VCSHLVPDLPYLVWTHLVLFVLREKIRTEGKLLCQLLLLFVLYPSMKGRETFSPSTIGNKSVKKYKNEGDLEKFTTLLTLFILTP